MGNAYLAWHQNIGVKLHDLVWSAHITNTITLLFKNAHTAQSFTQFGMVHYVSYAKTTLTMIFCLLLAYTVQMELSSTHPH